MKNTIKSATENHVYIAHIRDGEIQTVGQHLEGVSRLAGEYGAKVGLEKCGKLAGLLHDIVKLTDEFQQYIFGGEGMMLGKKGPDHSTAGAVWLLGNLPNTASQLEQMTAQLGLPRNQSPCRSHPERVRELNFHMQIDGNTA